MAYLSRRATTTPTARRSGYLGFGDISGYSDSETSNPTSARKSNALIPMVINGGASAFVYDRLAVGLTGMVLREALSGEPPPTRLPPTSARCMRIKQSHPLEAETSRVLGLSVLNLGPGL